MLFPENPEKQPTLWQSVFEQLIKDKICLVIENGVGDPFSEASLLDKNSIKNVLTRMQSSDICRISANRGQAVSPHFSAKRNGKSIFFIEFLSYPSEGVLTVSNEKLIHDLETSIISLFFSKNNDDIFNVFVPLHLTPWIMSDVDISSVEEGLLFTKK